MALLAEHRQRVSAPATREGEGLQRDSGAGPERGAAGEEGGGDRMSTRWDAALSHLLMPALEAYEQVSTGMNRYKHRTGMNRYKHRTGKDRYEKV